MCRYYGPNHRTEIEFGNVRLIEDGDISGRERIHDVSNQKVRVEVPINEIILETQQ